jgi:hypothetical protein
MSIASNLSLIITLEEEHLAKQEAKEVVGYL